MTLAERKRLHRVYSALDAVPGAGLGGGGTMSASAVGVMCYANDIRVVTEHCKKALMALFENPRHVDFSKEEQDATFNREMNAAEAFIKTRNSVDWRATSQR